MLDSFANNGGRVSRIPKGNLTIAQRSSRLGYYRMCLRHKGTCVAQTGVSPDGDQRGRTNGEPREPVTCTLQPSPNVSLTCHVQSPNPNLFSHVYGHRRRNGNY